MRTTSQTQNHSCQLIVRLDGESKTLEEKLEKINKQIGKWEELYKGDRPEVIDCSSCHRNLYLLQCRNHETIKNIDINTKQNSATHVLETDGNKLMNFPGKKGINEANNPFGSVFDIEFKYEITTYLLDTGVDTSNWENADKFMKATTLLKEYEDKGVIKSKGYSYIPNKKISPIFEDNNGHGTFGIRTITEGLTTDKLKVVPLKIFDENGQGTLFNTICAMYHAIDHGADIINLSAGFDEKDDYVSLILENVILEAYKKGIFIVTAAGNTRINLDVKANRKHYPAVYSTKRIERHSHLKGETAQSIECNHVISVASLNPVDNSRDTDSNFGSSVSVATYGKNIRGHKLAGKLTTESGTSVAAFYVTKALAAIISKNKGQSVESIRDKFYALLEDCPSEKGTKTAQKCLFFDTFLEKLKLQEDTHSEAAIMI